MGEAMMALVGVGACVCSVIVAIGSWLACGRVVWGGGDDWWWHVENGA